MTDDEWGWEPEHAVDMVRHLTAKHGHPPNYNMLALAISHPSGVLSMSAIEAALKAGLIEEFPMAFGGCKTAFRVTERPGADHAEEAARQGPAAA